MLSLHIVLQVQGIQGFGAGYKVGLNLGFLVVESN